MKEEILNNLNQPSQLEKLYRADKATFKREFNALYPSLQNNKLADFWNERLNFEGEKIKIGSKKEIWFVVIASLVAYFIARIPDIFSLDKEYFYPRNIGFVIFPVLSVYFAWKNKLSAGKIIFVAVAMTVGIIFINFLPDNKKSDTLALSCIHLLLFLWSLLAVVYTGSRFNDSEKRLDYLKYNGDLIVMTTLILISGGIMTAITIGLFDLIGFKIEDFYFQNIGILGLATAPILGTYLTQSNPNLVGRVSPVIARIFSPLVTVMLVIYLVAIVYSGKDPYNDREFLLTFNALLVGVMAIIFFSLAEIPKTAKAVAQIWILFVLSLVTTIVNGVAISAILFRITSLGITPNRVAVLGGNLLMLFNLILIAIQLFKAIHRKNDISKVKNVISNYLQVYFVWTIIVTFLFPLIFGFK